MRSHGCRVMLHQVAAIFGAFFVILAIQGDARADCVPARRHRASSDEVTPKNKALATVRYKAGNELLRKQDYEGALGLFLRSRELWHRSANTKNAAICLFELGRYPEALALYEEILEYFAKELAPDEHAVIVKTVADLQKRVLLVDVGESSGIYSIDDQTCGSLPRKEPVYLLPGSHILHVLRPGVPEAITEFSGLAGQRIQVRLPEPRKPPPVLPIPGAWFATIGSGPLLGFSAVSNNGKTNLEFTKGVLGHAKAGYRFTNGLSLAVASGTWYGEREDSLLDQPVTFGNPKVTAIYDVQQTVQFFARYMGFLIGFEPRMNRRFDYYVRAGAGIIGLQSRQVMTATATLPVARPGTEPFIKFTDDMKYDGSTGLLYSNPAYAALDLGFVGRIGHFRIGFSLEAFITFTRGAPFVSGRAQPRKDFDPDGNSIYSCPRLHNNTMDPNINTYLVCIPAFTTPAAPSYHASVSLIPQLVFGLAQ